MTEPVLFSYLDLIPHANRDRPKFTAVVTEAVQPFIDDQIVLLSIVDGAFDLDLAVGQQLDYVGQWVGLARRLTVPIAGVFFSFDTVGLGFDQGVWFNSSYASQGIIDLDDNTYRLMLNLKAAANVWDGSLGDANKKIYTYIPNGSVQLQDNFDMTQTFIVDSSSTPSQLFAELVAQGYIEFKPAGVKNT